MDGEADHDIGISGLGAPSTMSMETTTTTSDESERSTTPSGQDESSSPRSPPELERVEMDMDLCNPALLPHRHPSKWTVSDLFWLLSLIFIIIIIIIIITLFGLCNNGYLEGGNRSTCA